MTAKRIAVRLPLGEALACELADRLEHREPAVSLADEALVDERGERLQVAVADSLRRLERPAAGEDREARQSLLLMLLEQVVAPGDRRPQRLLSLGSIPGATREEREPLLQPREQGIRRQDLDARGRQLDRERQAVEAAADLGDGAVGREVGPDGPGALVEEGDGVVVRQRRNRILLLQRQAERLAARREQLEVARAATSSARRGAQSSTCSTLSSSRSALRLRR